MARAPSRISISLWRATNLAELPPHKKLEQQIERIQCLLEQDGAEITWNDHIPDPDNPSQPRQIDISIRRGQSLTIVECRLHKAAQDVMWIEELMGRRISLGADVVIAVSASGFTSTARQKAERYGVILRDFATLSPTEICDWGTKRKFWVHYCEFTAVTCTFKMAGNRKTAEPRVTDHEGKPIQPLFWRLLLQEITVCLDKQKWSGVPATTTMQIANPLLVDDERPLSIELSAKVRRIVEDVELASVLAYEDPITAERHAEVARFNLGASEIIEKADKLAMIVDLSQLKVPDNSCFETLTFDAGRIVTARIAPFVGKEYALRANVPINIRVEFARR